jgi:hypothetical protein
MPKISTQAGTPPRFMIAITAATCGMARIACHRMP